MVAPSPSITNTGKSKNGDIAMPYPVQTMQPIYAEPPSAAPGTLSSFVKLGQRTSKSQARQLSHLKNRPGGLIGSGQGSGALKDAKSVS